MLLELALWLERFSSFFGVFEYITLRAILAAPRSATEGEGVMRGQMLEPRIEIQRVWRLD